MIRAFLPVFFTILIVVDPLGLVPLYIGLTGGFSPERKRGIVRQAVLISFLVLLVFVLLGKHILALLHIEAGSFYIAGGIMLFLVSMEMLFGQASPVKVSEREAGPVEGEGRSVAVFPLAIPMLAGPGTITAIILYTGGYAGGAAYRPGAITLMLIAAVILSLGIVWVCLRASDLILRVLGKTGVSVLERITGLLLSGMSVQFVYDGLLRLGIL